MLAYGVDGLQIDSVYEAAFREAFEKTAAASSSDALSSADGNPANVE